MARSQNLWEETFLRLTVDRLHAAGVKTIWLCDRGFHRVTWFKRLLDLEQAFVVRLTETAFPYRDALFLIAYQTNWKDAEDDQTNLDWCENTYPAMCPYTNIGAYVNIPDRTLADWPRAYYGDNLPQLSEVKRAYDPEDVFHFAQSIPLPPPDR